MTNPQGLRLNEALWEDLKRRLGTQDLIEWLEDEAERVARLGRAQPGRVDLFSPGLLRDRRISALRPKPYIPGLATIIPRNGTYEVLYAPYQRLEDTRFCIAHEIAHTFWFSFERPGEPISPLQRAMGDDPTIEWLCNRGGAAILLPRGDVRPFAETSHRALQLIPQLATQYLVPERLVARRLFQECWNSQVSVLGVTLRVGAAIPAGRIAWMVASRENGRRRKSATGRVVPSDMIPQTPNGLTVRVEIDGRWLLLTDADPSERRAKPLGSYPPQAKREAWVCRNENSVYIAIPTDFDNR